MLNQVQHDRLGNMTKSNSHNEAKSSNPLPWIAGAVLVLGLAVIAGFYRNSSLTVQRIQFSGNHFVSTEDLETVEVPLGMNPDSLDFGQIMRRFEKLPYVKRAGLSVQPGGELIIDITERQPIALLVDGSTKIYVDKDGIRLPRVSGKTVDVPILYGFSAEPMTDTLQNKAFKTVADFLMAVKNSGVGNATISEVAWTGDGVVALTNQSGVKLIFGKEDFANRLRNWEAFYGDVIKQKGIESMQMIDFRFKGQIVTRE